VACDAGRPACALIKQTVWELHSRAIFRYPTRNGVSHAFPLENSAVATPEASRPGRSADLGSSDAF
jgi:hypothetical protein